MSKVYKVSDLFFSSWAELTQKAHAETFALQQNIQQIDPEKQAYGWTLIQILRRLRKNPLLVDKINVAQAVDIYNDLKFLNEPWYYFPVLKLKELPLVPPEDKMARHTFDHFIYADNEFSSYIATQNINHLRRLLVTLYGLPGELYFDKECVAERADLIKGSVKEWQLNLVFFTYAQVRQFLMKRCKTLLPAPPKRSIDEPEEDAAPTGAMWLKLKHRLAETPAFQGYDNAGRANMYSSLDYLEDLAQQKENAKP
jgi:hypothetical protein